MQHMATATHATDESTDTASEPPLPGDDDFEPHHWDERLSPGTVRGRPVDIVADYDDEQYDEPYRDPDVLRRLYWAHELSLSEIGDLCSCSHHTVRKWMRQNDIPRRAPVNEKHGSLSLRDSYERFRIRSGEEPDRVNIHRLAAVAWFGYDEVVDKVIHHAEYEIKWLNIEWNLEPMNGSRHSGLHTRKRRRAVDKYPLAGNDDEIQSLLRDGYTHREIADKFGCTRRAVTKYINNHDLDTETDTGGQADLETFTGGTN